jgi:zinc transport system substrate-binding protein
MFLKFGRLLSIVAIGLLLFSGCGQSKYTDGYAKDTSAESPKGFTIVTSFYPVYISTINITKGISGVQVISMTKPQAGCLHDYQLTPEDMTIFEKADVFVINGAGMEAFLDKALKQRPQLKIIDASKDITLMKNEDGEENPHVWVSLSNAILQVNNISEQLSSLDSGNAAKYKANAGEYVKKLEDLRDRMHQSLAGVQHKGIITFHEAFPYFAQEFNLNIVAVIEREPGTVPSPREMEAIIEKIKESDIKALFVEPQYPAKVAETIAKETGAKVYSLDPVVTGEAKPSAYDDYINIMEKNSITLREALE